MAGITESSGQTIVDAIGELVGVFTTLLGYFLEILWNDFFVGLFLEKTASTVFMMVFAFIIWGFYTKYVKPVI